MTYNLLTRDEANTIVENTDSFYKTVTVVEGYNVEMYDYRLASHSDFVRNDATELRGLTFVYNHETNEWERNLLMNKFFNIGQCGYIKKYEFELEDGRLITFTENDEVKMSDGSVKLAKDINENDDIQLL